MEREVRSAHGLIPWKSHEDHGFNILRIKEWRKAESEAGRPSTLEDFYATQGLCMDCLAEGAQMTGWSKPCTSEDIQAAEGLGVEELPLYDVCPTCNGTGRAERSQWKGSITPKTRNV